MPSRSDFKLVGYSLSACLVASMCTTAWTAPGPAPKPAAATTSATPAVLTTAAAGKLSPELQGLLSAPAAAPPNAAWARASPGQVFVKVLIVAASTDPQLASLRADVLARGGSVFYNYVSIRAIAAMVPSSALGALASRDDVMNIAPNFAIQRHASLLQAASDAGDALPLGNTTAYDGQGVGIAVLDSGIDFRHKNLLASDGTSRVRRVLDVAALGKSLFGDGWNVGVDYSLSAKAAADMVKLIQNDKSLQPAAPVPDAYGHGTAVASVAAGRGSYQSPDSSGIAPGANLYDIRVLNEQGIGTVADVLLGIDWTIQAAKLANIRVMNLSLGADSTDSFLIDPVARAARSAVASGIVVVASAGNAGKDAAGTPVYGSVSSPGDEPSVITVGASNALGTADRSDDVMASFSSHGPTRGSYVDSFGMTWTDNLIKPDLVAPGNKVLVASAGDGGGKPAGWNVLARTYPQLMAVPGATQAVRQTLMSLSGTSFAAPAVAGAAAVLLQANPGLTPPLVKAILQYTATPIAGASLLQQGAGMINVEGALRLAMALRTDIGPAIAAGTIKAGDPLLAPGKTLPAKVSIVAGRSQNWGGVVYAGGTHLVSGDALFTSYQPIWDPALTWARGYVMRSTVSYQPASPGVPANTLVSAVVERNAPAQSLLTSGVRVLDGVALTVPQGSAALTTPLATLESRASSGMGYPLALGFSTTGSAIVADGFTMSQGFTLGLNAIPTQGSVLTDGILLGQGFMLNEGFVLSDGFMLNEGFLLREGFMLNEGFLLREVTAPDPTSSVDQSFMGD